MLVNLSKVILPTLVMFSHVSIAAIAAYIPQALRSCISVVHELSDAHSHNQKLGELYSIIRENRIVSSDAVVYNGVTEALKVLRLSHNKLSNKRHKKDMISYLETYLKNANDRAVLLAISGSSSQAATWTMGTVQQAMVEQKEAFELLLLSNELFGNLTLSGMPSTDSVELNSRLFANLFSSSQANAGVNFTPADMTNAQGLTSPVIIGTTGVGSALITGWPLAAATDAQYPITIQFEVPADIQAQNKAALEIGILVPKNGFAPGGARFQVKSKYISSHNSFDVNNIAWSHTNFSADEKIHEPAAEGSVRYLHVKIPLSIAHVKPGQLALLNISRVLGECACEDYAGDLYVVSAAFKYTSNCRS